MAEFVIIDQPIVTRMDPHSGKVVEGREIDFRDIVTGQIGRVFVSHDAYNAGNVRGLILAELGHMREIHDLSE